MAKRVSPEEIPFNPVKEALTRSVLNPDADLSSSEPVSPLEVTAPPALPASPKAASIGKPSRKESSAKEHKELRKLVQVKRFLLTDDEDSVLEQLVVDMGRRLETNLTLSHLLRATATLLLQTRDDLLRQSEKMGRLKRPSNNDPAAIASFEHNITRLIDRAIRNSRPQD